MSKYVGQVEKVFEKQWNNGGTSYSVKIQGSPLYFRMGKSRFPGIVEVGNVIEFDAEQKDDKSAEVKGSIVAGKQSPKVTNSPAGVNQSSGGTDWAAKDASIQYQSSRKDAIELVGILVTSGALKLPADAAKKVPVIEAVVDKYTAAFYADIADKGAVKRTTTEPEAPVEKDVGEDEE